jgi:D-amino peptidase
MKVWMSLDMEGVAGVVDWEQCRPGNPAYALGCELLQAEVNAAITGAIAGGATEVVLNDSHGRMANLDPRKIAGDARYLSGRHKPLYLSLHPDESCRQIAAGAKAAMEGVAAGEVPLPAITYITRQAGGR